MKDIDKNTELIINNDINIEPQPYNFIRVSRYDISLKFNENILSILKQFYRPNTIQNAVDNIGSDSSGVQEWIDLTSFIFQLIESEFLVTCNKDNTEVVKKPHGYNSASIHIKMLNDRQRTKNFMNAIRKTVKKGNVVLDIGTGTGILAITAAMSGAKHVYAAESSGFSYMAQSNFEKNGFKDRITVLQGLSTQLDIPEKADVLVSEMIGNEPLGENILEIFSDSIKRHLKKNFRVIPERLKIFGLPVNVSQSILINHFFNKNHIRKWDTWYGIDFSSMVGRNIHEQYSYYINAFKAKTWNFLSSPVPLADIELKSIRSPIVQNSGESNIKNPGLLNGILIFFESQLCPGISINSNPLEVTNSNHWLCKVWLLPKPVQVEKKQKFRINYNYKAPDLGNRISIDLNC
jgi:protein arginine N-methyltransferase 1